MMTENETDRLMGRFLSRDLQGATVRLTVYGILAAAVVATILSIAL